MLDDIADLFYDFYDDEYKYEELEDDSILIKFPIEVDYHFDCKYYQVTKYSPEEFPDLILDEPINGIPGIKDSFSEKEQLKQKLMKLFKENAIKFIEINEDEVTVSIYN